jgi:hypothetical protein
MEIISRHLLSVALLLALGAAAGAAVQWRDAPAYVTLFAPVNQRQSYSAAVSAASLDSILADVEHDAAAVRTPGSWQPRDESASDAFGTAGPYNEWQLKRLYGSRQARVARGARMDRGRVTESWTLISPYPAIDLRSLHPGTLRLVLQIAP